MRNTLANAITQACLALGVGSMVMQRLANHYDLMLLKKSNHRRVENQQQELYNLKRKAHAHIDWLVDNGCMERDEVYAEVAYRLKRPNHEVHLSEIQDVKLIQDIIGQLRILRTSFS